MRAQRTKKDPVRRFPPTPLCALQIYEFFDLTLRSNLGLHLLGFRLVAKQLINWLHFLADFDVSAPRSASSTKEGAELDFAEAPCASLDLGVVVWLPTELVVASRKPPENGCHVGDTLDVLEVNQDPMETQDLMAK